MRHLLLASALSLSLLAPGARADDNPNDLREQAYQRRGHELDQRERAMEVRALRDDQRDLGRIEALASRLQTMRRVRTPEWAVVALDADVQRELASEKVEELAEQQRDGRGAGADQADHGSGHRWDRGDGRWGRGHGDGGSRAEAAKGRSLERLRQEWSNLHRQYGRSGMERRSALMAEILTMARRELAGDRRDLRESRMDDRR